MEWMFVLIGGDVAGSCNYPRWLRHPAYVLAIPEIGVGVHAFQADPKKALDSQRSFLSVGQGGFMAGLEFQMGLSQRLQT